MTRHYSRKSQEQTLDGTEDEPRWASRHEYPVQSLGLPLVLFPEAEPSALLLMLAWVILLIPFNDESK